MTENPLFYATSEAPRGRERLALCLGMVACVAGLGGTCLSLGNVLRMLDCPVGSPVLFSEIESAIHLGRLAGFLLALPLGVLGTVFGWRRRSTRWLGFLGILMALAAIFLAGGLCDWIVSSRKLVPFRD